ncbi:AHH domain-containing protein [Archangium lansingense]|uniref:AHH domain-containing protein n=1 Tax=Archangium lansingense TaxID=2995310 RepID=A0ABT4AB49_9BACT|nr:AHH domain-containing protein [Archangium lansinium]MCY1078903.1 AHH domain-containing protein [Archangium lansinium]
MSEEQPGNEASSEEGGTKKQKKNKKKTAAHVYSVEELKLHKSIKKSYEGGACLAEHAPECQGYQQNSCNYRWQGTKVTLAQHKDVFHDRSDALVPRGRQGEQVQTSAYPTKSDPNKFYPGHYATHLSLPAYEGDWHIDGPKRPGGAPLLKAAGRKLISNGKNFTADTWPYWNNAHHLVPKGMFGTTIAESKYAEVIRRALLEAEYNIHHQENMLLMPQDEEVALLLHLPRHLRLTGDGKLDHPKYNNLVKERLTSTIQDFEKACQPPEGVKHDEFKVSLSKTKLEDISADCRRTIIEGGPSMPGEPLDNIRSLRKKDTSQTPGMNV